MAVRKLSISFPAGLAKAVRKAARKESGGNISAWLAQAAETELRRREAAESVAEWEGEHGAFTPEELDEGRRRWQL